MCCQCKTKRQRSLRCHGFCFWRILVYLQYKPRFRLNFFLSTALFFSPPLAHFTHSRAVPFSHRNLIYSFRIACFSIKFDAGSLWWSWMESRFHLTHYRMLFFNDVSFFRFAILSFSLFFLSLFFALSRDNCLFRSAFTRNFDIIWYSVSVCLFSLLMIFILASFALFQNVCVFLFFFCLRSSHVSLL